MLVFRSKSYNWQIKLQVLLFNNSVQALSLKESFRMKTETMNTEILTTINLSPSLFFIIWSSSGEYWQSVKDSADTVDLSYLQAQRRRLRRDSDSEAVSAIASLSMRAVTSDR